MTAWSDWNDHVNHIHRLMVALEVAMREKRDWSAERTALKAALDRDERLADEGMWNGLFDEIDAVARGY